MARHPISFALRRSGLTRRAAAAVLTMVLLVSGTAVSCLTGSYGAGAIATGSKTHPTAAADHEPTGATLALEHQSDGPAAADQRTSDLHGDLQASLPAGGEGCSHNFYDSGNGTPVRAAAPDLHILHASSDGLPGDSYEPVRIAGIQNPSPMTPSLVQLSISRT